MLSKMSPVRKIWLGREYEVGELEAGLDELSGGHGRLFLITGEPGIGKTRMADELSLMAAARGVSVHWGRAWEAGGAPRTGPSFRSSAACAGDSTLTRSALSPAHMGPRSSSSCPSSGKRSLGSRPGAPEAQPIALSYLTGSAHSCTRLRPRLPSSWYSTTCMSPIPLSLLLLQFLERDLRSGALLVVGTYRDAEARLAPDVGRTLTLVARGRRCCPFDACPSVRWPTS